MSTSKNLEIINELICYGAKPGLNQLRLVFNLELYLDKYNTMPDDFIEKVKKDIGFCNGLTLLYHYSKWSQMQSINTKFNNDWFNDTIRAISAWNGIDDLEKKEAQDFLDFIKIIAFLQNPLMYYNVPISQFDLGNLIASSLLNTVGKKLKREYSIVSSFTLENLRDFLTEALQENKLVTLYYYNHVIGLLKDKADNKFYYDPNDRRGEIKFNSIDELATKIFTFNKTEYGEASPIGFIVSGFEEQIQSCLNQEVLSRYLKYADNAPANYCPLCLAARIGCSKSVNYFLKQGISIDQLDRGNSTALILAAKHGHIEIIKTLLKKGADPDLVRHDKKTALMVASQNGQVKAVEILIDLGVDPNQANIDGMTPLMVASQDNQIAVIEKLLQKGAEPNLAMNNGVRALMVASQNGHIDIITMLTKAGADPNLVMNNGLTALMLASSYSQIEAVKKLLKLGANPNMVMDGGYTAVSLATQNEIINLIEEAMNKDKNDIDDIMNEL